MLREPSDKRIFILAKALHEGYSVKQLHGLTKIDPWFLQKLENIIMYGKMLEEKFSKVLELFALSCLLFVSCN